MGKCSKSRPLQTAGNHTIERMKSLFITSSLPFPIKTFSIVKTVQKPFALLPPDDISSQSTSSDSFCGDSPSFSLFSFPSCCCRITFSRGAWLRLALSASLVCHLCTKLKSLSFSLQLSNEFNWQEAKKPIQLSSQLLCGSVLCSFHGNFLIYQSQLLYMSPFLCFYAVL